MRSRCHCHVPLLAKRETEKQEPQSEYVRTKLQHEPPTTPIDYLRLCAHNLRICAQNLAFPIFLSLAACVLVSSCETKLAMPLYASDANSMSSSEAKFGQIQFLTAVLFCHLHVPTY